MQMHTVAFKQTSKQVPDAAGQCWKAPDFGAVTRWLEKEDGPLERLVGYGVCVISVLYLTASMFRALSSYF